MRRLSGNVTWPAAFPLIFVPRSHSFLYFLVLPAVPGLRCATRHPGNHGTQRPHTQGRCYSSNQSQQPSSTSRWKDNEDDEEDWRVEEGVANSLEIEVMAPADQESGAVVKVGGNLVAADRDRSGEAAGPTVLGDEEKHAVVQTLDGFARAGVTNFIARTTGQPVAKKSPSPPSKYPSTAVGGRDEGAFDVVIREIEGSSGTSSRASLHFHARQRLPLPDTYGERFAEGFGSTEKEAETLAAMHAIRILDALGFPVYQLASKQRRHAEAARAAGRHAPLPGEPPQPPSTPTPVALRYQAEGAVATMERRLHVDRVQFVSVTSGGSSGAFTPFRLTLASPYFLDHGSVKRVKQFFTAYKTDIQRYSKVIALHKGGVKKERGVGSADAEAAVFLAQLRLPIMPRFGDRVCMGKASTKKEAIALACMHAELTIDALGLALYPTDSARQLTHVEECAKVGRCCASPGDLAYKYDLPSPPPLQLVLDSTARAAPSVHAVGGSVALSSSGTAEVQRGSATVESVLLQHSRAVKEIYQVVEVPKLEECAMPLLQHYLEYCVQVGAARAVPPFFVEALGIKFHETYRATVTVPLIFPDAENHTGEDSFVAVGISSESEAEAELAAATHALREIAALNHCFAFSEEALSLLRSFGVSSAAGPGGLPPFDPNRPQWEPRHLANSGGSRGALLLPVRSVSATHLGRILSPGLAGNKEHKELQQQQQQQRQQPAYRRPAFSTAAAAEGTATGAKEPVKLREGELLKAITESQRKLPRADWSLTEDADHRIIVAPTAVAAVGRNYVHTLSAVRTPDVFAVNRLKDYLERHGKCLSACLEHTVMELAESGFAEEMAAEAGAARNAVAASPAAIDRDKRDLSASGNRRIARALSASASDTHVEGARPALLRLHCVKCVLPTRVRSVAAMALDPTATTSEDAEGGPLSAPSARVVAHGEAYTMEEAVLMCAMHAELLLDALGIIMYDHPELQRRHVDTARMLGRWAPMAAGAVPPLLVEPGGGGATAPTAVVPPPLRKEHLQSCLWARLEVGQRRQQHQNTTREPTHAAAVPVEGAGAVPAQTPAQPTDDELCDWSNLQAIHRSEIFRMAARHVQIYYHSRGSDFYRSVRQYTTPSIQYGNIHRAIAELPVPATFGRRFAVGCASNKKQALSLCATHAAWTLEALGIPIYSGKRQLEYAKASELRGRSAPRPGSPMRPPGTPSPKGLCCFVGGAMERPDVPDEPTLEELKADHRVWPVYIRACRTFIDKNRETDLQEALFEMNQAPRSGIDVEDDALDVVERAPLNTHAKHALTAACAKVGLPAPSLPFHYEMYGRAPNRRFLTKAAVLGTPYTARGAGRSPTETLARTAMHYEYLVTQVAARNAGANVQDWRALPTAATSASGIPASEGRATSSHATGASVGGGGEQQQRHFTVAASGRVALYDATWGQYTVPGQEATIALYCGTQAPFRPMTVQRKATSHLQDSSRRSGGGATATAAMEVFTARIDEPNGLLLQVNSQPCVYANDAAQDVIKKVFMQLQSRPPFQAMSHFLRRHPHLRIGAFVAMQQRERPSGEPSVQALVRRASEAAAGDPGQDAPTISPFPLPHDILQTFTLLKVGDTPLRSHLSELLCEMVGRQLGQASSARNGAAGAPILAIPAVARDVLPLMGLLQKGDTNGTSPGCTGSTRSPIAVDGGESWFVTPMGVAVAVLLQVFPAPVLPPTLSHGHSLESRVSFLSGSLLPLQLGKLLLAGLMLEAHLTDLCKVAAIILCSAASLATEESDKLLLSEDLVDRVLAGEASSRSEEVSNCVGQLLARFDNVAQQVRRDAPDSPLAALIGACIQRGVDASLSNDKVAQRLRSRKLRLAIACATFSELWVAHPQLAHSGIADQTPKTLSATVLLESQDGLRTALLKQTTVASASHSAGAWSPCYAAFDCAVVSRQTTPNGEGGKMSLRQHFGHMSVFGARVCPSASLIAAAPGCNTAAVLSVDEEYTERVALFYGGTVPLLTRSAAAVHSLQALLHAIGPRLEALQLLREDDPLVQALLLLAEAQMETTAFHYQVPLSSADVVEAYVARLAA